jgi:hypothetical protein
MGRMLLLNQSHVRYALAVTCSLLLGCQGSSGGNAPGAPPVADSPDAPAGPTWTGDVHNGVDVTTGNGWAVRSKTSPISKQTLGNGWTIEVKDE